MPSALLDMLPEASCMVHPMIQSGLTTKSDVRSHGLHLSTRESNESNRSFCHLRICGGNQAAKLFSSNNCLAARGSGIAPSALPLQTGGLGSALNIFCGYHIFIDHT